MSSLPESSLAGAPVEHASTAQAAGGGSAAEGRSPGLVVQETSHAAVERLEIRGSDVRAILRGLARQRRLSRMRKTVLRFVDVARDGLSVPGFRPPELVMVTLTYADADAWEPRHISTFVQRVAEWLERRGHSYAYAWVLEMQQRGAPHYHVLFWLPAGVRLPKPDVCGPRQRAPLWPFGMTRVEFARSPGYIVKYTSKGDVAPFPFRARLFGVGASVRDWRRIARWGAMPRWIRDLSTEGDVISRLCHVGWLNRMTGEVYESPWRFGFGRDEVGWVVWFERRGKEAHPAVRWSGEGVPTALSSEEPGTEARG